MPEKASILNSSTLNYYIVFTDHRLAPPENSLPGGL